MASRSSPFHAALHRPRLILGVEKGFFAGLVIAGTMFLGLHLYSGFVFLPLFFLIGRWLSELEDQFVPLLLRYLQEGHVFDSTPRTTDRQERARGWGRDLPT